MSKSLDLRTSSRDPSRRTVLIFKVFSVLVRDCPDLGIGALDFPDNSSS